MVNTTCAVGSFCTLSKNEFTKDDYDFAGWVEPSNALSTHILKDNNGGFSDSENSTYVNNTTPGINFGATSSDTNGKGLYYTSINTEDNKTTYYFRGAVDNNFVKFGTKKIETASSCIYNDQQFYYKNNVDFPKTEEECLFANVCDVQEP